MPLAEPLKAPVEVPVEEEAPDIAIADPHGPAPSAEPVVRPGAKPDDKKKPKRQSPYAVVLHNDSLNTMYFVVGALRKVFGYDKQRAKTLMLRAHKGGKAQVWTGTRELAELRAEQLTACGADPLTAWLGAKPLRVTVEPVEEE
jgi:ATP-dependent Clp protease adaptor protein ClpS